MFRGVAITILFGILYWTNRVLVFSDLAYNVRHFGSSTICRTAFL
jgi:hypothetical protein